MSAPAQNREYASSTAGLLATTEERIPAVSHRPSRSRLDKALLLLLLVAAGALRVWALYHTEVAARDSIGYIRYAWQLQHQPWAETLRHAEQHPGYPLTVAAVFLPLRHFLTGPDALIMQQSAQVASILAGILLTIPMFYLGKELFNRSVGFWAALLFQCLPASGRVLADGLSEGVFLLFAVSALLWAVRALRGQQWAPFAITGLWGGLAYLTRPEGALIVAVTGVVLLASQGTASWRRPWKRLLACGAALSLATLVVAAPYIAVIGHLTVKPTPGKVLKSALAQQSTPSPPVSIAEAAPSTVLWAVWWTDQNGRRLPWGLKALGFELMKGSFYVLWAPMLLGLWWFRDRFRWLPGSWVLLLVSLVIALLLWRVAVIMGYVSDRHTLLILLSGSFWAIAALQELPRQLSLFAQRWRTNASGLTKQRKWTMESIGPIVIVLTLIGAMLPKTLEPLHANRSGFREAGLWLHQQMLPGDVVLDPYCWSHYYAGQVFLEGQHPVVSPDHQPIRYVVLERSGHEHSRLPFVEEAQRLASHGQAVFRWTSRRKKETVDVVVYAVPMSVQSSLCH